MVELLSKWRRASARLLDELRRNPTNEEVARMLGRSEAKAPPSSRRRFRFYNSAPQSDQTEAGWSLGELVIDEQMRTPDDKMLEEDVLAQVMSMLQDLDPRESTVLEMRFGLGEGEPHTLKEIGQQLGLTRERVRQIENEALRKLGDGLRDPRDFQVFYPFRD